MNNDVIEINNQLYFAPNYYFQKYLKDQQLTMHEIYVKGLFNTYDLYCITKHLPLNQSQINKLVHFTNMSSWRIIDKTYQAHKHQLTTIPISEIQTQLTSNYHCKLITHSPINANQIVKITKEYTDTTNLISYLIDNTLTDDGWTFEELTNYGLSLPGQIKKALMHRYHIDIDNDDTIIKQLDTSIPIKDQINAYFNAVQYVYEYAKLIHP